MTLRTRPERQAKSMGLQDPLRGVRLLDSQQSLLNPKDVDARGIEDAPIAQSIPGFAKERAALVAGDQPASLEGKSQAGGFPGPEGLRQVRIDTEFLRRGKRGSAQSSIAESRAQNGSLRGIRDFGDNLVRDNKVEPGNRAKKSDMARVAKIDNNTAVRDNDRSCGRLAHTYPEGRSTSTGSSRAKPSDSTTCSTSCAATPSFAATSSSLRRLIFSLRNASSASTR